MSYIAVIGGGSWGTTLAAMLADKNYDVSLWAYEKEIVEDIRKTGINRVFLPGFELPKTLKVSSDIAEVIDKTRFIVNVVPVQHTRAIMKMAREYLNSETVIVTASKGIEIGTHLTVSQIIREITPCSPAVLSGPSFATEVIRKLPTAVSLATENYDIGLMLQEIFNTSYFRVYTHNDMIGAELGGAIKNVIAIAAGITEGLSLGQDAKAALITRGLAEMTRMGVMMGAKERTFSGLAGIGDLVLTCGSQTSRNFTTGFKLGQGMKIDEITASTKSVAEGVPTAKAAYEISRSLSVEMPIIEQVYGVLYEGRDVRTAVDALMNRSLKAEFYG